MKQPNNHIDETLEDILFEYENEQNPHQDEDYRFERTKAKLDQYYADLYRNKILEARKEEAMFWHDQRFNYEPDEACPYCMGEAYSLEHEVFTDRLDTITAQFNSKGDK